MYVVNDGAWQVLGGLQAWQITEFPRRPHARQNSVPDQDRADLGTTQRLQALVSAVHYGAPVAFGWMREHAGGRVRVLAAGLERTCRARPGLLARERPRHLTRERPRHPTRERPRHPTRAGPTC